MHMHMHMQVEEFGREMYKLNKLFNSKAKQLVREREREGGADLESGMKRDTTKASLEETFAPLKLSSQVQQQIKQFKV